MGTREIAGFAGFFEGLNKGIASYKEEQLKLKQMEIEDKKLSIMLEGAETKEAIGKIQADQAMQRLQNEGLKQKLEHRESMAEINKTTNEAASIAIKTKTEQGKMLNQSIESSKEGSEAGVVLRKEEENLMRKLKRAQEEFPEDGPYLQEQLNKNRNQQNRLQENMKRASDFSSMIFSKSPDFAGPYLPPDVQAISNDINKINTEFDLKKYIANIVTPKGQHSVIHAMLKSRARRIEAGEFLQKFPVTSGDFAPVGPPPSISKTAGNE